MSADADLAAWLRKVITERLELARAAGGGEWHTGCGGTRHQGDHHYPGCERIDGDGITIYDEGGHTKEQADHIAANDPRDTIARCEAELAILDEHHPEDADYRDGDGIERTSRECITCEPPGTPDNYPCPTVRLLAAGYKHWPGYRAEWGS